MCVSGVFCPTLFSKVFGDLACKKCETNMTTNVSVGFQCTGCRSSVVSFSMDVDAYPFYHSGFKLWLSGSRFYGLKPDESSMKEFEPRAIRFFDWREASFLIGL